MTTESRPRFKITYATLRNDNEELHAAYEAGLEEAKRELGGHHRNFIDGLEREAQAETTVALADRHETSSSATSRRAPAATSRTRSPPPAAPSRPGPRRRGASASP